MEKITFESMPASAQRAYRNTDRVRKISLFASLVIGALIGLIMYISSIGDLSGIEFITVLFAALLGGEFIGCWIHGLVHGLNTLKKLAKKFFKAMIFGVPGIVVGVAVIGFALIIFCYAGCVFAVADLILYILKKPLVYPFEHKKFLETDEAQMEILASMAAASESEAAMADIENLKSMLDKGLITQAEFDSKKAELLQRI